MKFKIINKNNEREFYCDEDVIINDNFNETLDNASFRISHQTEKIDIEIEDRILIFDENNRFNKTWYMIISDYSCVEENLEDKRYTYEINACSETKLLEGIILPNLSITTLRSALKRSIAYYLNIYNNLYGKKIRKYNLSGDVVFENAWNYSDEVINRFSNVECPEMQWNMPTFREVLNSLFMVDDCIPVLKNNVIELMDLTERKGQINNYNYIRESQSIEDYVSEIQMTMQNVLQTNVENVNNVVSTTEFIPFTSEQWQVTSENLSLKVQYPILNIKHLWLCAMPVNYEGQANGFNYIYEDLMNLKIKSTDNPSSLIKEYKEYQTLEVLYRPSLDIAQSLYNYNNYTIEDYFSKYQNFNLYFNRYSNEILGFNNLVKSFGALGSDTLLLNWLKALVHASFLNKKGYSEVESASIFPNRINAGLNSSYYSTFFKIEYETTAEQVFRVSKSKMPSNSKIIIDNQTNSFVDAYSQGNLEQQKVNRLGNKQYMINQRCNNTQSPIEIKQMKDDLIIYQTQYQIFNNHIETNAIACENYILEDYFTGVSSKIRTWVNAKDEALQRHDLLKFYCEFSFNSYQEGIASNNDIYNGLTNIPLSLFDAGVSPIKYAIVKANNNYYAINCLSRIIGNSLVLTTGFDDNAYIGKKLSNEIGYSSLSNDDLAPIGIKDTEIASDKYGGVPLDSIKYVDNNIEMTKWNISFYDHLNTLAEQYKSKDTLTIDESQDLYLELGKMPYIKDEVINSSNSIISVDKFIYKDNKEIPKLSIQFEMCSDTRDIYITKYYLQNLKRIRNVDFTNQYKTFEGSIYKFGSEVLPNNVQEGLFGITKEVVNDNCLKLELFRPERVARGRVIYITDKDNNIMLCFKSNRTSNILNLYCNILYDRNKSIY